MFASTCQPASCNNLSSSRRGRRKEQICLQLFSAPSTARPLYSAWKAHIILLSFIEKLNSQRFTLLSRRDTTDHIREHNGNKPLLLVMLR
jgi:hypothetical protein